MDDCSPVCRAVLSASPWRRRPDDTWDESGLDRYVASIIAAMDPERAAIVAAIGERWAAEDAAPTPRIVFLIARCLNGCDWDVNEAYTAARAAYAWWNDNDVARWPRRLLTPVHWAADASSAAPADGPTADALPSTPLESARLWRAGWHGCDLDGRPLYIDRTVGMDYYGIYAASSSGEDDIVHFALAEAERMLELYVAHAEIVAAALSEETGGAGGKEEGCGYVEGSALHRRHTVLVDCTGLGRGVMSCMGAL